MYRPRWHDQRRDNGPGIKPETVTKLIDYRTKTSSREAYVGVSRGAQGNALQSLLAMPYALDGAKGVTTIAAHGVAHRINFAIDQVRRVPLIDHQRERSLVQSGTRITSHWPLSAGSQLVAAKAQIVQIVRDFGWLNPHASFRLTWDGERPNNLKATDTGWRKWSPADATPAHWFDVERFSRLIAAYVGHDEDRGRDRTVREFVAEFRGLARSDAQKLVLDAVGASRLSLREFFERSASAVCKLLAVMKANTKCAARRTSASSARSTSRRASTKPVSTRRLPVPPRTRRSGRRALCVGGDLRLLPEAAGPQYESPA